MIRRIISLKIYIELFLYALSISFLSYYAEKQKWDFFIAVVFICIILFVILKYIESKPFQERIKSLEKINYEFATKANEYGIQKFFNMKNNQEIYERNIINIDIIKRGNQFSLLADTGNSYIDPSLRRHWDYLKLKLNDGIPIRLLLTNPFCESKQIRNKLNNVTTKIDPKLKLDVIYNLYKNYGRFDIKFTNEVYCSLFFSESEMIYDPYHLGKTEDRLENYFLAFYIKQLQTDNNFSYYNVLKSHFDYLWSNGINLQEFVDNYSTELTNTIFENIDQISRNHD